MNLSISFKKMVAVSLIATSISCSTHMKPVLLPQDANPKTELETLKSDRLHSIGLQANLFAPYNFEQSEKYFNKAV